jgi:hypothetical protein
LTLDINSALTLIPWLSSNPDVTVNWNGVSKLGGALSHTVGYWLIIGAVLGFIGVLMGLKFSWGFK